jgi:hypothetical protein
MILQLSTPSVLLQKRENLLPKSIHEARGVHNGGGGVGQNPPPE